MIIRQAAFENSEKMQKVALHTHTTRSDGRLLPHELIAAYEAAGFDLVAITDHSIYNREDFSSTGVLVIPGVELESEYDRDEFGVRYMHTVALGKNDSTNTFLHDEATPYLKLKSHEGFQEVIDLAHKRGNITFYCHPEWSRTPAKVFGDLKGNFAYEIWNTGSALGSDCDNNAPYWEELFSDGHPHFGVATDDAHSAGGVGRGYVMVNAKKDVGEVIDALKAGAFYSSCGPVIKDFYFDTDTNTVHIVAESAEKIWFSREKNWNVRFKLEECEDGIHGYYKMSRASRMMRACVVDPNGRRAWTNPIYWG